MPQEKSTYAKSINVYNGAFRSQRLTLHTCFRVRKRVFSHLTLQSMLVASAHHLKACIDFHNIDFTRSYGFSCIQGEKLFVLVRCWCWTWTSNWGVSNRIYVFVYKHQELNNLWIIYKFSPRCFDGIVLIPINLTVLTHPDTVARVRQ